MPIALNLVMLNSCLLAGEIPREFKRNRTILIPKGNAKSSDPSDFRPITIGPILHRVLNSILAKRISDGVEWNYTQRGFVKSDGCLENTILLEWVLRDSVHRSKPLFMLLLDIRKAFDSVSHDSIKRACRSYQFPSAMTEYNPPRRIPLIRICASRSTSSSFRPTAGSRSP